MFPVLNILTHSAAVAVLIGAASFAPPQRGDMVAIGLGEYPAHSIFDVGGVRLLDRGPFENSLVIRADSAPIAYALQHQIILIRTDYESCGFTNDDG